MKIKIALILLIYSCSARNQIHNTIKTAERNDFINLVNNLNEYPKLINIKNDKGLTPLMIACVHGNYKMASHLISKGAELNLLSDENYNALIYASLYGRKEILELLLHEGALDNVEKDGRKAIELFNYLYNDDSSEHENFIYSWEADKPPEAISDIDLSQLYPEEGKNIKSKVTIIFRLKINEKGVLKDFKILSSNNQIFDDAASRIITRIRFLPAKKDNKSIKSLHRLPLTFSYE